MLTRRAHIKLINLCFNTILFSVSSSINRTLALANWENNVGFAQVGAMERVGFLKLFLQKVRKLMNK